ncbi:MAG: tetratricopeptide repeat protein [Deltaproteobacteria bacterium]|nr:tetratricopeptide repeat protein [Deltaproteobacteria bacterium]
MQDSFSCKAYLLWRPLATAFLPLLISSCATSSSSKDPERDKIVEHQDGEVASNRMSLPPSRTPSPEAYRTFLLSEILLQEGDLQGAIAYVKKAQLSDHRSVFLSVHLSRLLIEVGDLEGAERAAQDALNKEKGNLDALRILARLRTYSGDYDAAEIFLRRALAIDQNDPKTSRQLVQLLLTSERIEEARVVIEEAMEEELGAVDGYLLLAELFASRGDIERAQSYALLVVERERSNVAALELLTRLHYAKGEAHRALSWRERWVGEVGDSRTTRKELLRALFLAEEEERAEELLQAWLSEDQSETMVRLVAETLEEIGRRKYALRVLGYDGTNQDVKPTNFSAKVRVDIGRILLIEKKSEPASRFLCEASGLDKGWRQWSHGLCVRSLLDAKLDDKALQVVKKGLETWPASLTSVGALVELVERSPGPRVDFAKKDVAALCAVQKRGRERAQWLDLQLRVALFYDGEDALLLKSAQALRNENGAASLEIASVVAHHYAALRNAAEVASLLEGFIDRDEAGYSEWNFLAYTLASENLRLEDALALAKRALITQPNAGYIVDTYGWVLFHMKRYDEAVKALERAKRLTPKEPEILFHLAQAREKQGAHEAAEKLASEALGYISANQKLRARILRWQGQEEPSL